MQTTSTMPDHPSFSRAVSHVTELASLQGRLLLADLREGATSVRTAVVLAVIGSVVGVAAATLGLAAAAIALQQAGGLSLVGALLLTALGGSVLAAAVLFGAVRAGRDALATVARSYDDLEENLRSLAPDDDNDRPA